MLPSAYTFGLYGIRPGGHSVREAQSSILKFKPETVPMTAATPDTAYTSRHRALELANGTNGSPEEVVKRATAYHAFLTSTAAPANPAAAGGGAKTSTPPKDGAPGTTTKAAGASAPGKADAKAADAKPAAGKPAAAKPAADKKPAAAAAAAGKPAANAQAVPADTKAPGGTYTYGDVVAKLREVQTKLGTPEGRTKAFAILASAGDGVQSVRDLKPAAYDAVVEGCDAALVESDPPEQTGGGTVIEDPTATPELDDLGMPV